VQADGVSDGRRWRARVVAGFDADTLLDVVAVLDGWREQRII
jgi:hypothetical protein